MTLPTYAFYRGEYMGDKINSSDFPRLIARAGAYLDGVACAGADEQSLSMAACAVAEAWQANEQGGDVLSEAVGRWSRSYAAKKPISDSQRLLDAAKLYLGGCAMSARWV